MRLNFLDIHACFFVCVCVCVRARARAEVACFQSVTFEDPASLPFELPAGLDDVTAEFMTQLLQHRGMLNGSTTVTAIVKKGVGMTAGK